MHSVQRRKINSAPRIDQQDKTIHMSFGTFGSPDFLLQEMILFQKTCLHSRKSQISHLKFPKQNKNHYSVGYRDNIKPSTSQILL